MCSKALIINSYLIKEDIYKIILDIKKELFNGKLSNVSKSFDNIKVTCPHHKNGKESKPSCFVYCGDDSSVEYGWFRCFTCGEQGPLWKFVAECFDKSDNFGKTWLIKHYGIKQHNILESMLEDKISFNKKEENNYLDMNILTNFQDYHPYMSKRKITLEVISKFNIKYDNLRKSIVFPVWDENNNLVMLTRRNVDNKIFIIDKNKEKPVYLLNYIKNYNLDYAVVVESQIDALTLWGYHIPAIALMGTGTSYQYEVLNKSQIRHYILMLDGDDAGRNGVNKFIKNIRKDVLISDIKMPITQDVNDLQEQEIYNLLSNSHIDINKLKIEKL